MATWPKSVSDQERTRRLIDLFLVSVLLDAGAGQKWSYKSKESGKIYRRSEGLAVASLEMFKAGAFSSNPNEPCQVDSAGLKKINSQYLAKGLQITEHNTLAGLEGRASLLVKLGDALQNQDIFGIEARPGYLLGESRLSLGILTIANVLPHRLPPLSPIDSSFLRTCRPITNTLERSHGRSCANLALNTHYDRRCLDRRRLAL
jgi:hypothetical protein